MSTSDPPEMSWDLVFPGDEVEIGPRGTEIRRLASATRRMIEELMSTSASIDAVAEAAALVEGAVDLLAGHPHDRPEDHVSESAVAGDPGSFLEFSPLIGRSNPIAPPLELALVDGRVVGTGVFGSAYEGPPGHVHGGHIAAAFDEVLGMVATMFLLPTDWRHLALGFLLFRLFDVIKPFPANAIDRRMPGGTGVMLDDLSSAVYANLVGQAVARFL